MIKGKGSNQIKLKELASNYDELFNFLLWVNNYSLLLTSQQSNEIQGKVGCDIQAKIKTLKPIIEYKNIIGKIMDELL